MHGDLYAHNILIDQQANALLSDFGAAFSYDTMNKQYALALERIEVRGFGCLLEDLINHVDHNEKRSPFMEFLVTLKNDCVQDAVAHRPDFITIYNQIKKMTDIR